MAVKVRVAGASEEQLFLVGLNWAPKGGVSGDAESVLTSLTGVDCASDIPAKEAKGIPSLAAMFAFGARLGGPTLVAHKLIDEAGKEYYWFAIVSEQSVMPGSDRLFETVDEFNEELIEAIQFEGSPIVSVIGNLAELAKSFDAGVNAEEFAILDELQRCEKFIKKASKWAGFRGSASGSNKARMAALAVIVIGGGYFGYSYFFSGGNELTEQELANQQMISQARSALAAAKEQLLYFPYITDYASAVTNKIGATPVFAGGWKFSGLACNQRQCTTVWDSASKGATLESFFVNTGVAPAQIEYDPAGAVKVTDLIDYPLAEGGRGNYFKAVDTCSSLRDSYGVSCEIKPPTALGIPNAAMLGPKAVWKEGSITIKGGLAQLATVKDFFNRDSLRWIRASKITFLTDLNKTQYLFTLEGKYVSD